MASILLLTNDTAAAAYVRTKAAFETGGHVVTGSTAATTVGLDAAWGGGFDVIATVTIPTNHTVIYDWVKAKWQSGTPVLVGGAEAGAPNDSAIHLSRHLGLWPNPFTSAAANSAYAYLLRSVAAHPVTAGFSGNVQVLTALGVVARVVSYSGGPAAIYGTVLGHDSFATPLPYMSATDKSQALASGTAPARAVVCGWMFGQVIDYTDAGRQILAQSVDWLALKSNVVTVAAPSPVVTIAGVVSGPAAAGAVRAIAPAPTLVVTGEVTNVGSVNATAPTPVVSITGEVLADDEITATSRTIVRSPLADPVDVEYLTATSRTTITSSAALSLDVVVNPSTKRPDYTLLLVDRHGWPIVELDKARLGHLTRTRNGNGSFSFSLDKDDPKLAQVRQFSEVQVRIGSQLVRGGWFVITDPAIDNGREWKFQCAGLRWHLASRRIGKELPELLRNGDFDDDQRYWHAKWFKGSAAEAPPHTTIVTGDKAMEGGNALEATGVERVTRNSVQSDAIFIANRPYAGEPLANGFLPGGEKIIRDNIKNIAKGSAMTVEGHTADADAGDGYALSVRRAEAAREVILKARPDLKVTAVGKGETEQVAPNNTEANQAKNRRLVIIATITSVGHRQAVTQRITYTQPKSARRPMELLLDARVNLIDYVGPSKDGWLLYIDRRRASKPGEINDSSHTTIAEDFPVERWTTDGTSINVPADGQPWIFEVRLYPTAGKTRFDQISLRPSIYTAWYGITRPEAIRNLVQHAQDTEFHKADLNISTNCRPFGPRSDFEYAWLDRRTVDDAISEELRSDSSPDFEIVVTDHRRIATTWSNRGRRTHVPLKLGDIVTDYSSGLDGDKVASTAIVQASRQRGSKGEAIVRTTRKDGLVLERLFDAEQGSTDTVVRAQARAALRYGRTDVIRSVTCDPDRTIWLMERIDLGDICPVQVDDGGLDGNGDYRIEQIALDPNRHQLTYQLAVEG